MEEENIRREDILGRLSWKNWDGIEGKEDRWEGIDWYEEEMIEEEQKRIIGKKNRKRRV